MSALPPDAARTEIARLERELQIARFERDALFDALQRIEEQRLKLAVDRSRDVEQADTRPRRFGRRRP